MKLYLISMAAGLALDLCLGDPYWLPHPVRAVGSLIGNTEKKIRRLFPQNKEGELAGGFFLVLLTLLITGGLCGLLLAAAGRAGAFVLFLSETVMVYYLLAARSLYGESIKVYHFLKKGEIEKAREQVSMIVGRDTASLSDIGIAKAAIETVAENTSDGVIAPLFYLALGGPVLGWLYKAVNTMDSMVGYKNETYQYFGRVAAKLDDLANFIPSRISAGLMLLASAALFMDTKNAVRIYKRDRLNHKSPNSAQTESVCAGALNIQLAGDALYFGMLVRKPFIGDDERPVEYEDIKRANALMYMTTGLSFAAVGVTYWLVWRIR